MKNKHSSLVFFAQKNPILRWALLLEDRALLKKDGALLTYLLIMSAFSLARSSKNTFWKDMALLSRR